MPLSHLFANLASIQAEQSNLVSANQTGWNLATGASHADGSRKIRNGLSVGAGWVAVEMKTRGWAELSGDQRRVLLERIEGGQQSVASACNAYGVSMEQLVECARYQRPSALRVIRQARLSPAQPVEAKAMQEPVHGSTGITATLEDISLPDLIQTVAAGGKDAIILIQHGHQRSRLWLARGEAVDAESGKLKGEAAVYRILTLKQGDLVTTFSAHPRERTIQLPLQHLMLRAALRQDQAQMVRQDLVSRGLTYMRLARAQRADENLSSAEATILQRLHERCGMEELVAYGDLGELETLSAIVGLSQRGLIERSNAPSEQRYSPTLQSAVRAIDMAERKTPSDGLPASPARLAATEHAGPVSATFSVPPSGRDRLSTPTQPSMVNMPLLTGAEGASNLPASVTASSTPPSNLATTVEVIHAPWSARLEKDLGVWGGRWWQAANSGTPRNLLALAAAGVVIAGVTVASFLSSSAETRGPAEPLPSPEKNDNAGSQAAKAPAKDETHADTNRAATAAIEGTGDRAVPPSAQARGADDLQRQGSPAVREVKVAPRHARLWLDGQLIGAGSASIALEDRAAHELTVTAPGYTSERMRISRDQLQALEDITLVPNNADLRGEVPMEKVRLAPPLARHSSSRRRSPLPPQAHLHGNEAERAALGDTDGAPVEAARQRSAAPTAPTSRSPQVRGSVPPNAAPNIEVIEVVRPSIDALD